MTQLTGKTALITGGTSGIGEATAELFVAEGANVVITGRSVEKGEALADRLGAACTYFESDVMDEQSIAAAITHTEETHGSLDILFNNAGGPVLGAVDNIDGAEIERGTKLLLASTILGIRYAVEPMRRASGGVIINNASIAGHRYRQGSLLYSALKAAVIHYTKLAAVELGPQAIRVNCISPGAIATPIFWGGSAIANTKTAEENEKKLEKLKGNLANATPLPMAGEAIDIAQGALYLASDAGRFVNGHDLVIDGGRIAMFNEGA